MDTQLFCDARRDMRDAAQSRSLQFGASRMIDSGAFGRLVAEIGACTLCAPHLLLGPRPIVRGLPSARLLIISQAPGRRVHDTRLSFNDRSGDRLRAWLAMDCDTFYDESRVAIMGMAFCYPGSDGKGGDLPPRRECAPRWHARLRSCFPAIELTLLVGSYAIDYYLPGLRTRSMTEVIARWYDFCRNSSCCRIRAGGQRAGCATIRGSKTRLC